MPSVSREEPIGVAVVGLGRTGLFHLERLSLQADFRVTAVFDVQASRSELAEPFGAERCRSWSELLGRSDWQLLWLTVPPVERARCVVEALQAGKHVVVDHPVCLNEQQLAQIGEALSRSPGRLSVLSLREPDSDFLQALQTVRAGQLGPLRSLAYTLWTFLAGDESRSPVPVGEPPVVLSEPLVRAVSRCLDQLLQLVSAQPVRVHAFSCPSGRADGSDEPLDRLKLLLQFDGPQLAEVDIHLSSLVTLETGWVLSGERAGYRAGRCYEMTSDGEIFSLPVQSEAVEWEQTYGALSRWLRGVGPSVGSFEHAAQVARLLFAAVRSLAQAR